MVQVVYGDILLVVDFCMNFFVLHTSSVILRRRIKGACLCFAALLGSVYSLLKLFVNGNNVIDCIISLAVGLLMCFISFGGERFLKTIVVFFSTSSLVGGIMFATYFFMGSYHVSLFGDFNEYAYSHMPVWLFMVLATISMIISWLFSYMGRESSEKIEEKVVIEHRGRKASLRILMDSGNFVKEPISGKYVIMVGRTKANELFGKRVAEAAFLGDTEFLLKNKFRLVCAAGLDGIKHTYYAFLPDRIYLAGKNEAILDAYVAICDTEIFFGGCDGLAHPSVIA